MAMDPIVNMGINMRYNSMREQAVMRVAKMALDRIEQTGDEVNQLPEGGGSPEAALGNLVDIRA